MTRRRRISASERMQIWKREGGVCHICGQKIDATRERYDIEHVIPLELGGDGYGSGSGDGYGDGSGDGSGPGE